MKSGTEDPVSGLQVAKDAHHGHTEARVGSGAAEHMRPMHPEIVQRTGQLPDLWHGARATDGERRRARQPAVDMTRRFWVSVVLTIPLVLAMLEMIRGFPGIRPFRARAATPVGRGVGFRFRAPGKWSFIEASTCSR
jgi:hypothetical protein